MIAWIIIIVAAVIADQATKLLVVNFLDRDDPFVIIEGVFRFTYVENRGAAFGSFDEHRWVFMIISTLGILALAFYLWKFPPDSKIACAALSMIIGGGIGNMIDRVALGYVVDFIDFYAFPELWIWVFNVADAFVCVGAGILLVWCVYAFVKESKEEKKKKLADAAGSSADTALDENSESDKKEQ